MKEKYASCGYHKRSMLNEWFMGYTCRISS